MQLWLDESDVVVAAQESRQFVFQAAATRDARLWIAPRIVWTREEALLPALRITLNGTPLGPDRLVAARPFYIRPCTVEWPPRDLPKCPPGDPAHCWLVRTDDDFIVGNDPKDRALRRSLRQRRNEFVEGLEPSYAFDVASLLRPAENTLRVEFLPPKHLDASALPPPPDPAMPFGSFHAQFLRVGAIPEGVIRRYNRRNTKLPRAMPRVFNALIPEGFEDMVRHYSAGAESAARAEDRAMLHFGLANFLLWKGRREEAERRLRASVECDPRGGFAAPALFLLGASRAQAGDLPGAVTWWDRAIAAHDDSAWADAARREKILHTPDGFAKLLWWPRAVAVRTRRAPALDGTLNDPAWNAAPPSDPWGHHTTRFERAAVSTECRMLYDERALYVGFRCEEPFMAEAYNRCLERDSAVWNEDAVEFFINPRRDYACAYEFEVGIEMGIVDCVNVWDISLMPWDPDWQYKTAKHADHWTAQMAIPWDILGATMPQPGEVWLCNPTRVRPATAHREGRLTCLGPSSGRFAALEHMACVQFR